MAATRLGPTSPDVLGTQEEQLSHMSTEYRASGYPVLTAQHLEDPRTGNGPPISPTLMNVHLCLLSRPLPCPQGRVAAPPGADVRGQKVPFN